MKKIAAQLNFIAIIPQVLIVFIIDRGWKITGTESHFALAVMTFLVASFLLRTFIPRTHRLGITFIKHQEYAAAIDCFDASYRFFSENVWLDKFRAVALLTVSGVSYREMALLNSAYCYEKLGDAEQEKKYYEKTLIEFPENARAMEMLEIIKEEEGNTEANSNNKPEDA